VPRTDRAKSGQAAERSDPVRDDSGRVISWWHVPERPGVGESMLRGTLVWFVSLVVLVVIAAIVI
jgi:hypothetical protein